MTVTVERDDPRAADRLRPVERERWQEIVTMLRLVGIDPPPGLLAKAGLEDETS